MAYRKHRREKQLRRCSAMREAKGRKRLEVTQGEPVRVDRVIEVTIRDSHRPLTVLRLHREHDDKGRWGRWHGIGKRALGWSGIGKIIGKYLE